MTNLNPSQLAAVRHTGGPALVLAGPGSGKTAVITARTAYLTEELHRDPSGILVITFTKAAATEMSLRFQAMEAGKRSGVMFSTFHSFCFQILRHAYHLNVSNILKDDVRYQLMREILADGIVLTKDEPDFITELSSEISILKNSGIDPQDYTPKIVGKTDFLRIYEAYQERMQKNRLIDFDDMLLAVEKLFAENERYRARWAARFEEIMVDEAQDMNHLQYKLLGALSEPEGNVFLVGDDDQSIYGFRGASPAVLQDFTRDFRNVVCYRLTENYRSRAEIVEAARLVMEEEKARFAKPQHAARGAGGSVVFRGDLSQYANCQDILQTIRALHAQGLAYREMAVLFRTARGAELLAGVLRAEDIPFFAPFQTDDLFAKPHVRDVLSYLRMSASPQIARGDFLQVMNKPLRYFSRDALEQETVTEEALLDFYEGKAWMQEKVETFFAELAMVGKLDSYAALNFVRKGIGYDAYLTAFCRERGTDVQEKLEDLAKLSQIAKTLPELPRFLEETARLSRTAAHGAKPRAQGDRVVFSTLHGAKGLEYTAVFLPDVTEGNLPYQKAVLAEEIAEERRLLYVGMTRAKDRLYLYGAEQQKTSRFLENLIAVL